MHVSRRSPEEDARIVGVEPLVRADLRALVQAHFDEMITMSPPEVSGVIDLPGFADPAITLYAMREGDLLLGCGALRELSPDAGEIKTMRIASEVRGRRLGGELLDHLLAEARRRGYRRVYLETGAEPFFTTARSLYRSRGFTQRGPFGDYKEHPHCVFMELRFD